MPRGIRQHATDFDSALAELYGAIKIQLIFFAAETGFSADRVAQGVSALLSPSRQGVLDQLPSMQREATGIRGPLEPLALAQHAHSSEAPPAIEARRGSGNSKNYWASMTKEQRKAEMNRRLAVAEGRARSIKEVRKAEAKSGKPLAAGKRLAEAERKARDAQRHREKRERDRKSRNHEKQKVYQARHEARKAGLPIPPLPGEAPAARVA